MRVSVLVIIAATVVVLFGGMYVRVAVMHADATSLTGYVTTLLPLLIPALAVLHKSQQAKDSASRAEGSAAEAVVNSAEAVANTNGKLDISLTGIRNELQSLKTTMDRHLEYHAEKEG